MNIKDNALSQRSQTRIERAFLELLEEQNPKSMNVSAICKKAHVNRSTFYAHYVDIFALVNEIQEKKQQELIEIIESSFSADSDNVLEVMTQVFRFVADNNVFYTLYLENHSGVELFESLSLKNFLRRYTSSLPKTDIERHYRATFFIAGVGAVMREWLREGCKESPLMMAQYIDGAYFASRRMGGSQLFEG